MRFSKIAEQILFDHAMYYAISTAELISRYYFGHCRRPAKQAARLLDALVGEGFLGKQKLMARPPPIVIEPLFRGIPTATNPDAGALAYFCEKRWAIEPVAMTCFHATKALSNRLGGFSFRKIKNSQASHDLYVSEVYLHLARREPAVAAAWVHEGHYAKELEQGEKVGDARILVSDGEYRLVECLGRYSRNHIQSTCDFARRRRLVLELW